MLNVSIQENIEPLKKAQSNKIKNVACSVLIEPINGQ